MATLVLDTLRLTQKLKSRGYSEEQAVGFVEALQEVNLEQVATKADINEVSGKIADIKYELLKWMFSGFLAVVVLLVGIFMKLSA